MKKFIDYVEEKQLEEGMLSKFAAPAVMAAGSLFGSMPAQTQAQQPQPTQAPQPKKEIGKVIEIGNNTYEVSAIGRKIKLDPTYAINSAKVNAQKYIMKHLNINEANFGQIETVSVQHGENSVIATFRMQCVPKR